MIKPQVEIHEEPLSRLAEHASISIAFDVERVLDVTNPSGELGGFQMNERRLDAPYRKDYDDLPDNHPTAWEQRFDLSGWALLTARHDQQRVGGAVIAFGSPDVEMLEGRRDLAVLWDIRVLPEMRRQGVAGALFSAVEQWAKVRGCNQLKIETQNINVAACKFYASRGCALGAIHRFAYPEFPEETQLIWYKVLGCVDVP